MASIIQQLKGTAAEVAAKTFAVGVLVWNETAKRWHGGDGVTAGGIAMARYDERNDGSLGYEQRVETAASNAVTVADIGKAIVGNRATAIAFNLAAAATLTSKFVAVFKNINAGTMTVVPNGADLIDGVNAAITIPSGASVIIKGDGSAFRTFLSNGDVTGSAINNAAALTGANLADNDKVGVYDASATSLAGMTITEFVAGIFKTARKIANAYFLSSFRLWDATDNTKGLAFLLSAITTGTTRTITVPDRDVDLSNVLKSGSSVTLSGTSVDFLNIPAGTKLIHIVIENLSLSGSAFPLVQLGDSGGVENTGYNASGVVAANPSTVAGVTSTAGFIAQSGAAANQLTGILTLALLDPATNKWMLSGNLNLNGAASVISMAGGKALSATLDRVRLTSNNGTDTFDGGVATIIYH